MIDVLKIRERFANDEFETSYHSEVERYAEGIGMADLEKAISNSIILEEYPNDPRGPSCLLLGYSDEQPIHIVCGLTQINWVRIITVYIPKLPKWIDERTRFKGGGKDA